MEIKRISIWTDGDPSVGIRGESCQIVADGDFILDPEDRVELERIRTALIECFGDLYGERARVTFDFELEA